jgi:hypothetical protein
MRANSRVEADFVRRRRQLGRPHLVERLIFGRGDVAGHQPEIGLDPVEPLAGLLIGHDGVGEGRRRGIGGDRGDLALLLVDGEGERLVERRRRDLVPLRHPVIGAGEFLEQDIVGHGDRDHRRRGRRFAAAGIPAIDCAFIVLQPLNAASAALANNILRINLILRTKFPRRLTTSR